MLLTVTLQFLNIDIHVLTNGTAEVRETYSITFPRSSLDIYKAKMMKNNIEDWWGFLNITYHVNPNKGAIHGITLYPEHAKCSSITNMCFAKVLLDYKADALFKVSNPKPRFYMITLDPETFSFPTTPTKSIIIPDKVEICLHPDDKLKIEEVFPPFDTDYCWGTGVMAGWRLSLVYEEPLEREIISFFNDMFASLSTFITSPEGISFMFLSATALISFLMLGDRIKH